jgi:hypothetical protein
MKNLPMHQLSDKLLSTDNEGNLHLSNQNLTALVNVPKIIPRRFGCSYNKKLQSLIGGPTNVGGRYSANDCALTSFNGIAVKIGGDLFLPNNPLTSLQGINQLKEMKGLIYLDDCPITSHILGVFFIKGCSGIYAHTDTMFGQAAIIVNRHISKGRAGLLPCTQELIEAGLADFAQI